MGAGQLLVISSVVLMSCVPGNVVKFKRRPSTLTSRWLLAAAGPVNTCMEESLAWTSQLPVHAGSLPHGITVATERYSILIIACHAAEALRPR